MCAFAGAAFINPCGPPLSTLSSTACIKCLVQGCRRSCTDGAALPGCNGGAPSAVAAITDAGTGSLLLQELTIAGCQSPVAHIVPHMCALPGAESLTRAPGSLHIYADGVSGATSQFNQTIINGAECAPQSSFLSAENPVSMDLQKHVRHWTTFSRRVLYFVSLCFFRSSYDMMNVQYVGCPGHLFCSYWSSISDHRWACVCSCMMRA